MKTLKLDTTSRKLWLFMYDYAYNEVELSKELDIPSRTISRRIKYDDWRLDEIRAIKRLFKNHNCLF